MTYESSGECEDEEDERERVDEQTDGQEPRVVGVEEGRLEGEQEAERAEKHGQESSQNFSHTLDSN